MTDRSNDLRRRTLRSGGWVALRLGFVVPAQFATVAFLDHLLDFTEFGQLAVCTVVLALAEAFSQTGLQACLVREEEDPEPLLDATWSLQVVRGVLLAGVVAAVAYPLALYSKSEGVLPFCLACSAVPFFQGFRSVGEIQLQRNLAQGRIVACEITLAVFHLALVVALAWWLRSAWALVLNNILFAITTSSYGYFIHPHRPRFTLDWSPLRRYFRFGVFYNLTLGSGYLMNALDRMLIARWFSAGVLLGIYDRVFTLNQSVVRNTQQFVSAVVYPSLSAVTHDLDRFRRNVRRYLILIVAIYTVGTGVLLLVSAPVVSLFFPAEHRDAALGICRALLFYGMFRGLTAGLHCLFDLFGRSQPRLVANLIQIVAIVALFPLGARFGLTGIAIAVSVAALVGLTVSAILLRPVWREWIVDRESGGNAIEAEEVDPVPALEIAGS